MKNFKHILVALFLIVVVESTIELQSSKRKASINSMHMRGPNSMSRTSRNAKRISDSFQMSMNAMKSKKALRSDDCPFKNNYTCNSSNKYQSFDGSCNNLLNPLLGRAETPFKRLLKPVYDDGIESPRTLSASNKSLPNPRYISRTIMSDNSQLEKIWTNIFTHFGQFLTHDITSLAITAGI
jgi:hypothetical protein